MDPNDAEAHSVLGEVLATQGQFDRAKSEYETSLRLNPSSFSILVYYVGWASTFGEPERGAMLADRAIRLNPNYKPWACEPLRFAYFMAGRYSDALKVMERRTPKNYSRGAWVQRTASFVVLGREAEARATRDETLKRHPDLTIESHVGNPALNDTEPGHLIRTMKTCRVSALLNSTGEAQRPASSRVRLGLIDLTAIQRGSAAGPLSGSIANHRVGL